MKAANHLQIRASIAVLMIAILVCAGDLSGQAVANASVDSISALQNRLTAFVDNPRFSAAQWGIKVVSLDSGKLVFEHDSDKLMTPASNLKLYTCALALDRLGGDHRIKTSILATAKPDANGTVHGDLVIVGRGDPTFSARFNNGERAKLLEPLIRALIASGVKRIEGDLVGDESYFWSAPYGDGWAWDDLTWAYAPPVSALNFDDNAIGFSVRAGKEVGQTCSIVGHTNFLEFQTRVTTSPKGSGQSVEVFRIPGENTIHIMGRLPVGSTYTDAVSVGKPALYFVSQMKEGLRQRGVSVLGQARVVSWVAPLVPGPVVELGSVESRPVSEIVKETMKVSQNLYAQLLLLQVGAQVTDKTLPTDQAGLQEMRKFLKEVGVKPGAAVIKEGAGLSSGCQVTPSASVALLTYMTKHRCSKAFLEALPIGGVDGTLREHFKGTAAEKRVWAKTGTKDGVSTISGYVATQGNERWVFSVMLNNYRERSAHEATDAVVRMLAESAAKTR